MLMSVFFFKQKTAYEMRISDWSSDVCSSDLDEQTGFTTKSILCAPIRTVKGEIIGVTQALNKKEGSFDDEDLEMLEAMTSQAAVALQSSQFVERMKRSREQELEFLDIVADVTSEIELGALLQKVMGEATRSEEHTSELQ